MYITEDRLGLLNACPTHRKRFVFLIQLINGNKKDLHKNHPHWIVFYHLRPNIRIIKLPSLLCQVIIYLLQEDVLFSYGSSGKMYIMFCKGENIAPSIH